MKMYTYSLVSVILVSGANGCIPVIHGGDDVLELCRDDNLFVDVNTDGYVISFDDIACVRDIIDK